MTNETRARLIEVIARAISHVKLESYENEPFGMNASRKDVDAVSIAALDALLSGGAILVEHSPGCSGYAEVV